MDHHVPRAVTTGLRMRGVDVLTAYEDGSADLDDSALLDRAAETNRIMFTRDEDFLVEAARRQRAGVPFSGIVYAHQERATIGQCVSDLEIIATLSSADDMASSVTYLPL